MSRESLDTRLLVVRNERSTNANRAKHIVELLRSRWPSDIEEVHTKYKKASDNIHDLTPKVRDGDTVVACGGDGQGYVGGNIIIQSGRQARLAVMPCGNANDLAISTYGADIARQERLYALFERGRNQAFGGIRIEGLGDTLHALGNAAFGNSANTIQRIGGDKFRAQKTAHPHIPELAMEAGAVVYAAFESKPFEYEEDGERSKAVTMDFVTSRLMAKLMHFDILPYGQEMTNIELGPDYFKTRLAWQAMKGLAHRLKGETIQQREITLLSPVTFQRDGEFEGVEAGTTVTLTHEQNIVDFLIPEEAAA